MTAKQIAIIGAGMAGLACGRLLSQAGHQVHIFDKSRGLGGRLATRRADFGVFDHGAPYLRQPAPVLQNYLQSAAESAIAAEQCWYGTPGMSAVVKPLAAGLEVHLQCEIDGLSRQKEGWALLSAGSAIELRFDCVVLAIPQPQAARLVSAYAEDLPAFRHVSMQPVWAGLFAFDQPLIDAVVVPEHPALALVIPEHVKPGRSGPPYAVTVHADAEWSQAHLELEKPEAAKVLLAALRESFDAAVGAPLYQAGHRWRYARTQTPLGQSHIWQPDLQLGLCGDWCLGSDAGDAFQSGQALAQEILA